MIEKKTVKFQPYFSIDEGRKKALSRIEELTKAGCILSPIITNDKKIYKTFLGESWCKHFQSFVYYQKRLPRGLMYVRNGFVIDLKIIEGHIQSLVSDTSLYEVKMAIVPLSKPKWFAMINRCIDQVDSILELLKEKEEITERNPKNGSNNDLKFELEFLKNKEVLQIIINKNSGLLPHPTEIKMHCSCPDWSDLCKHAMAVLYAVGVRLDERPEELFLLRGLDYANFVSKLTMKNHKV